LGDEIEELVLQLIHFLANLNGYWASLKMLTGFTLLLSVGCGLVVPYSLLGVLACPVLPERMNHTPTKFSLPTFSVLWKAPKFIQLYRQKT
jgi:hypothetical protein